MSDTLASLKLLAQGGQADIYEIDGSRVLRVLRNPDPEDAAMLRSERDIMAKLHARGVDVPQVYDYSEVDGRPALAMERVSGPSMMDLMLRQPLRMRRLARELARLHCEVLGSPAVSGLMDIKKRVDFLIGVSKLLDDDDRRFIREQLALLPEGAVLLHGDFHPGNILTCLGRFYIIDWFGASSGSFLSDVAHTYLLCANKPRIPGEGALKFRLTKAYAVLFGRTYLKEIRARLGFDMGEFGRWMAVRAAERTAYGQPSELASRVAFVKACRKASAQGIPPSRWHKLL